APLKSLCLAARDAGLSGMEPLYGIPGTLGGAIYMNAGAYGGEIADLLVEVTVVDTAGEVKTLTAAQAELSYRHSRFMTSGEVILSAVLSLRADEPAAIRERMEDFLSRRREKQPLEYPSAGSFFKRPEGHFAAALIDQCGLKGLSVGGAQISEKHAGFLINRGGATCKDILALSEEVSRRVWEETGVRLEREVRVVGE
ncbi:MAG: UDP-N-acetylmuramate dehydrogenase, partial [Clostridia bacterium]|nr:UDP-N-acetylmuramate dehydrogenase [Clostridia bacterium]